MPACRWCCPATSRRRTGTASRRCASCSRARAPTPPSTASARDGARRLRHHAVDDLARPRQRDERADVLARRARHSDGAVLRCLLRRRARTRTSRRSRARTATALPATARTCCRSIEKRRSPRPRRSSTIPTRTPARRWSRRRARDDWDACHGLKLSYSNPETGDFAMPTIGTFIQLLPKGFKTARYRSTDATVFAAIEGKRPHPHRRPGVRVGPARPVRGAELALGHARGGRRRRCCSRSPTGRCSRSSICSARTAATRDTQCHPGRAGAKQRRGKGIQVLAPMPDSLPLARSARSAGNDTPRPTPV